MKKLNFYIALAGVSLMLCSCAKEVQQEDLVHGAVEIKIAQWRSNLLMECKANAYTDAEDFVDSLLLAISLEKKLDTIPKPKKPGKPIKPAFKTKPDSIVVNRIYKEE